MKTPKPKAVVLLVLGQVQRVGYRRLVERAARRRGLVGYVENKRDGTVRVVAEGPEADLRAFVKDINVREEPVVVERVEERWTKTTGRYPGFMLKPGRLVDELQEGLGVGQEQLATLTDEFKDYKGEFRGFHDEFRDYRGEFKGFLGEFHDYRGEFREYRQEFKGFAARTDENFKILGDKYGEISAKLTNILETLQKESADTRAELKRSVDNLSRLVDEYISRGRQQQPPP